MTEFLKSPAVDQPVVATMILAHGAGAPMDSAFMNALCGSLAEQGITTLRFEFPYMVRRREEGSRRPPDRQPVLVECWREVFAEVKQQACQEGYQGKLLIGGKSMGGRMASIVAEELKPDGFCCFGYPFYPPGKTTSSRTEHFLTTQVPGLILQGTRDTFGKPGGIDNSRWPSTIELAWLEEGDHDYKPGKRSGLTQLDVIQTAAAVVRSWL